MQKTGWEPSLGGEEGRQLKPYTSKMRLLPSLDKCQSLSHVQLFAAPWAVARQAPLSMEFSRQEYCLALLQGIFPTQGSNPGLLYCRQICFPWSYQGGPRSEEGTTRSSCVQLGGNAWQFNSSYSFQTVFQLVKRPSV